jgi:hypothetical protein
MEIKVADEVWIAAALLQKENPNRNSFSQSEIIQRVADNKIFGHIRPGIMVHVAAHCVANKKPNPGNYRMLYAIEGNRRRLFKESDDFHEWRTGGKITPNYEDIPSEYHYLIDWWKNEYNKK